VDVTRRGHINNLKEMKVCETTAVGRMNTIDDGVDDAPLFRSG
jgi:hypothetical protein